MPALLLRDYYTPYDDCMLRCLSGCFGVAIFCCGPGVCPRDRCAGHVLRRRGLVRRVRFHCPMSFLTNGCSHSQFCRVTGKLRRIERNNSEYVKYCRLHLGRSTRITMTKRFSCFAAALDVDPVGGTRGLGRVKRHINRRCNMRCLLSSFGGGGKCGESVRLSKVCNLCHRSCYKYRFSCGTHRTRGYI